MAAPPGERPSAPPPAPERREAAPASTTNGYLDRCPDMINDTRVRKVRVEGARFCLVHIRQEHGSPHQSSRDNLRRAEAGGTSLETIQTQIHDLLTRLVRSHELRELHLEGLTQGDEEIALNGLADEAHAERELRTIRRQRMELRQQIRDVEAFTKLNGDALASVFGENPLGLGTLVAQATERAERMEKHEKETKEDVAEMSAILRMALLAARPFVQARRIRLRASETEQANKAAVDALERRAAGRSRPGDENRIMRDREQVLFRTVASGKKPVAFTLYGAAHDFAASAEAWNKANPTLKFSVIELTVPGLIPPAEDGHPSGIPPPPGGGDEGVPLPPP